MNTRFMKTTFCRIVSIGGLVLLLGNMAGGAEPVTRPGEPLPTNRVVVRLSGAMLNSAFANKQIDRQGEVRDVVLGTVAHGRSRTTGTLGAQLVNDPNHATFQLRLDGVTRSQTTGYNGPAIIHSHSVTTFSATRQMVFEPGKGYYGLPPKITARTQLVVDGIDSIRGGLIGRIVRRRAAKIELAGRAEVTEIVRQKAAARVLEGFLRGTDEHIAQVNGMSKYRSLVATSVRGMGNAEPKYVCSTTADYLQIAARFDDTNTEINLAQADLPSHMSAPIEIFIHDSLLSDRAAATLAFFKAPVGIEDLINAVAGSVVGVAKTEPSDLGSLLADHGVRTGRAGNWQVIHVEKRNPTASAVAATKPSGAVGTPLAVVARKPVIPELPSRNRIWTSGAHTAEAEFVSLDGKTVRLRRVSGVNTSIAFEKLSTVDQQWINNELAGKARSSIESGAPTLQ